MKTPCRHCGNEIETNIATAKFHADCLPLALAAAEAVGDGPLAAKMRGLIRDRARTAEKNRVSVPSYAVPPLIWGDCPHCRRPHDTGHGESVCLGKLEARQAEYREHLAAQELEPIFAY